MNHPCLCGLDKADAPAAELLDRLARPGRGAFRFEYERKDEILAFLRRNYPAYDKFNAAAADRIAGMSVEDAQKPRALSGVRALGEAWWFTGDPSYGAAFQRFYTSVPTGEMFNWSSFNGAQGALELDAWFMLLDCPGFSLDGRIAWLDHLQAITANAWDVHTSQWGHRMLGPEGHNWYLHGMACLPFVGALFPELARSAFYLRTGMSVVEDHVRSHYRADGGARETCIGYQNGSLHYLWDAYQLASRNDIVLSAEFLPRLLNATKFLLRLASPSGGLPSFGDGGHAPGGLLSLASLGAALAGDGECKWYAETFREHSRASAGKEPGVLPSCVFWRTGLAGAEVYEETPKRDPNHVSLLLCPTGYAALRNSPTREASYLAMAGAVRGTIVTSHGHNDIFALEVHARGERFLGEMGCAPYGPTPGRLYDQSTAAHNCLAVEGREQQEIVNEWRWSSITMPRFRRWISDENHDFLHGVHEGYMALPETEIIHARKIFFCKAEPSYWIVIDRLLSNRENTYEAWWHSCVPGEALGRSVRLRGEKADLIVSSPEEDGIVFEAATSPGFEAYMAVRKLNPVEHPAFVARLRAADAGAAWLISPTQAQGKTPRLRRLSCSVNGEAAGAGEATALSIIHENGSDELCVSHKDYDAELDLGGQHAWGWFAFRRLDASGKETLSIVHTMADGATSG